MTLQSNLAVTRVPRYLLSAGILFVCFFAVSSAFSKHKPLWGDERFGLQASTRSATWSSLLVEGAQGQGSPAPLYYLTLKSFDPFASFLVKKGLDENAVYRWLTAVLILAGCAIFVWRRRSDNTSLSLFLVFLVLFSKETFYYASEARPYGLWFTASLLFLDSYRQPYSPIQWLIVNFVLALTATASLFLFSGAGVAVLLAKVAKRDFARFDHGWWGGIGLGVLVSLYYSLKAGQWGYQSSGTDTWESFLLFLWSYKWPILGAMLVAWDDYKYPNGRNLELSLTVLIWFLMGPFIFWLTKHRGFFFSERQYIYWTISIVFIFELLIKRFQASSPHLTRGRVLPWIYLFFLILCLKRLDLWATINRLMPLLKS